MARKTSKQYLIQDTVILTNIYSLVDDNLKDHLPKLKRCIEKFINNRHADIYDYAPFNRIYWRTQDVNDFFTAVGINQTKVNGVLPQLYYWKEDELSACKDAFTLTCLMCIRYLLKEKSKDKKFIELVSLYLAFSGKLYAVSHYDLWPNYTPKKEVMDYVVNYLLSQKFDLIRTKSVGGAIRSLMETWLERYGSELISEITDERIVYLIHQLHNRIHAFLLNISVKYYEAYEKKLYLNAESDNYTEDNYRLANNNSTMIASITERTMTYFTSNKINVAVCYTTSSTGVDPYDIKAIFETLISNNKHLQDLRFIINIMLADFCNKYPNEEDITGPKFIAHSIAMKPNTKDKDLLEMKNIVIKWLNTSDRYKKIKTEATRNNYYKAIIGYIAITINTVNKG